MKILITIILALCLAVNISFAQSFPNIDLSSATNSCLFNTNSIRLNQFASQGSDDCPTSPWFVSHGTPDILQEPSTLKKLTFVGSATKSSANGGVRSEGVSYRQTFFKDKWYKLSISFLGSADRFNILLANGVPIAVTNENQRSFLVPSVTNKQVLLSKGVNTSMFITEELIFIPDRDYECLWLFSEDSHDAPNGELNGVNYKINSLTCNEEPTKLILSTLTNVDYGYAPLSLTTFRDHLPLQPKTSASNRIVIAPDSKVIVKKNQDNILYTDQRYDHPVEMVAGNYIDIAANRYNPSRTFFEAEFGSIFSAKISNDIGCEDACEGFLPWNNPYTARLYRPYLNLCGSFPDDRWLPVLLFPKPYNAYRAKLIITVQNRDLTSRHLFEKVWEDPEKRALPEGCVFWKPDQSFPAGVYSAWLFLTNCDGEHLLRKADGTLPEITVQCGKNNPRPLMGEDLEDILMNNYDNVSKIKTLGENISSHTTKYSSKDDVKIKASPNPTTGAMRIQTNVDIGKSTIRITNILGKNEVNFYNNELLTNNLNEYDISYLPAGMYIISVIQDNKIISYTKINKL